MEAKGMYIHIPFCQHRCHYCAFLAFVGQEDEMDRYVDYICKEIALYGREGHVLDTLYFGGGTPSYLPMSGLEKIVQAVHDHFQVLPDCEMSIEINPESLTADKLAAYMDLGFSRYSMGVQSFSDEVLKLMGRLHRREDISHRVQMMKDQGCPVINLDLMFANPRQDFACLKEDLAQVLALDPDHISIYSLMVKEGSQLYQWVQRGQVRLLDDTEEREMYHYLCREVQAAGYQQYEISNFAREGKECRHNKKYWQLEDYLGIGLGATGQLGSLRWENAQDFASYYQMLDQGDKPCQQTEVLTAEDQEKEYIMLKMRLLEGIDYATINQRFGIDFQAKYREVIDRHTHLGLIQETPRGIAFTSLGLDIGNQFYLDII